MASDPESNVYQLKVALLTRMNQLLGERDGAWKDIQGRINVCSAIILEQTAVNQKFTEFHEMYDEINHGWPDELQNYPSFLDLLNDVQQLSEWMNEFEQKSNQAITELMEVSNSMKYKHEYLGSLLPTIKNSTDYYELQEIDLQNFQWVESVLPNAEELEQVWRIKNATRLINLCVLEIRQLFNTPVGVLLSELESIFEPSSSSDSSGSRVYF